MTHKQFVHVAENFASYAGKEVNFKMFVRLAKSAKYREHTATLVGVGVFERNETLVLKFASGYLLNVNYRKIAYPGE